MAKRNKKVSRTPAPTPESGTGKLESVSIEDLAREISRRQQGLKKLESKRERLLANLEELDQQIASAGGAIRAVNGRSRARNDATLADALAGVLHGKTMGISDAAAAVIAAGYQSTSDNFRQIVNQTLLNNPRFKRVDRGQYTVAK